MTLISSSYFVHPLALGLLGVLIVLPVLSIIARQRRRRALERWGAYSLLFAPRYSRLLGQVLVLLGFAILIAGIAGPQWGRGESGETASGRDLVCVLDLSRSMLAEDVLPSRLERAKAMLEELSWSIQRRGGDRVALVGFASRSVVLCPLTHDYDHFRTSLRQLDATDLPVEVRSAGTIALSGTRIGAGLSAAVDAKNERNRGLQDIVLLSDGDDPAADSEWRLGVQGARSAGIPVYVVGIGDPEQAHPISGVNGAPLRYRGQVIMTQLEEQPLREIAEQTGGEYLSARMGHPNIAEWLEKRIANGHVNVLEEDMIPVNRQRYTWALGLALMFLSIEIVGAYLLSRA
jgi:Ca-activated chloride channel family protein